MSNYTDRLKILYGPVTFQRKIDYLKYNLKFIKWNLVKPTVLEVGPGMGEFESFLNNQDINNIDIVDNDKNILKHVAYNFKIKNSLFAEDISKIDSYLRNYDVVLLLQVLEHIPIKNQSNILKTLYKHLKKNGYLIVVVPNGNNPLGLVERYTDYQHTCSFTEQSLKDLLDLSGIKNYKVAFRGFEIPPFSLINIVRILLQKILHLFLLMLLIINGGVFFKIMTPNLMMIIRKNDSLSSKALIHAIE